MTKSKKISSQDFLDLLDEEPDQQTAAFRPTFLQMPEKVSDTNSPKTDSKQALNGQQTDSKQVATTGTKQIANGQHVSTKKVETGSTTDSKENTNRQQTDSKQVANRAVFELLVGHERNLLFLIFRECSRIGELVSPELTLLHISEVLKCTTGTAKSAIFRLVEKGIVSREKSKTGRGGWIKFGLSKELYQDLRIRQTDSKEIANGQQLDSKQVAQRIAQRIADPPCSSSILNINNTTTTEPEFWLSVPQNLEGLISVKQLREFVRQGLVTADDLQTSLDGFAFDLEKGSIRAKNGNPVAILIGAIKGGGYISQQYVSELKASLAEIEKARTELHQLEASHVAEKLRAEFDLFRAKHPEAAEKLRPSGTFISSFEPGSVGYRMWLEEYKKNLDVLPMAAPLETNP